MKKLYFSILSAVLGFSLATAQTLTVANHAPAAGDKYNTVDCSPLGIAPGTSGAGSLWSFPTLTLNAVSNYTVATVPASLTGVYPSASVVAQTGTASPGFYSNTASNLKYWGGSFNVNTFPVNLNYSSAAIFASYPMMLGTTNSNTIAGNVTVSGFSGTFTGTCNINADGTGTLVLPARTFTNVIRVQTVQNIAFTIAGNGGTLLQTTYDYYAPSITGSKIPLFTITTSAINSLLGPSNQTVVTANSDYSIVGVKENTKDVANLNLFPNPAKGSFNVSFTNDNSENASLEIINAIGQSVRKENLGNEKGNHNINLEGIDSGIYFVKVFVGNSVSVKKLTIQ